MTPLIFVIITVLFVAFTQANAGEDCPSHQAVLTGRYWIFLQREQLSPAALDRALDAAAADLTPRALARRRKVIDREPPVRVCDLPVSPGQIAEIERAGCRVVRQLRYLNAVTVTGSPEALDAVMGLPFVREMHQVMAYPRLESKQVVSNVPFDTTSLLYGVSYDQMQMVNLPAVHARGYRGRGVLIGVQDTGFDNLDHVCFNHLQVVAAWDFINDDPVVSDEGDAGSGAHGTRVLSVIAGLDSGRFIGAAPEAEYVLTKTENSQSETPIEEDLWVAGLWFHDSLGVDVLSSSVSYRDWYEWRDMDGRTAVTTRAAQAAVEAGLVIVTSTGNTGREDYPANKIGAPADAAGVISVGGVDRQGDFWRSSSTGPTYDGRIKPDVAARAQLVYGAFNLNDSTYTPNNGTSFSCPVAAGIAALMLEAHRWLTPQEVMEILHQASSHADDPDTLVGWGIPDALAAVIEAENRGVDDRRPPLPESILIHAYPNPFNGMLNIVIDRVVNPEEIKVFDIYGRRLELNNITASARMWSIDFNHCPAGVYFISYGKANKQTFLPVTLVK